MTLSKAYSQYGASMGRRSRGIPSEATEVRALELHLDEGGYDSGGAYWGTGTALWRLTAELDGEIYEVYRRARDFEEVKASVAFDSTARVIKEISSDRLDEFVLQYEETALWSSTGDDDEPLDSRSDIEVSDEARATFRKDCEAFLLKADAIVPDASDSRLAHDFWLTRNRHGAGFEDGHHEKAVGRKLADIARGFGEVDLYIGDDGKVHQS